MRSRSVLVAVAAAWLLAGCSSGPEREREIGEAFVGPAPLKLRQDMDMRSGVAATVTHGEKLSILRRRRRFVKVRTAKGAEGWTDMRQLLSPEQMEQLDRLAERTRNMPSQGAASVYEPLNVHTEPNRTAPSFYRVKEHETLDVVAQELSARVPFEPKSILPPPQTPRPRGSRKPASDGSSRIGPPPMPPPPKLPENWRELSDSRDADEDALEKPAPQKPEPEPAKPPPMDDWSLVRLANGRAGWVLTGMLRMNIPDEVAQYSEGHRITSYFPMEDVKDGGQIKHNWLWTTLRDTRQPFQFDSFRCFVWNAKRHRYETAYIERNLKGYFPVVTQPVKMKSGKEEATYAGFTLTVEDDAGVRWQKTYGFHTYHVVLLKKEKWEPPPTAEAVPTKRAAPEAKAAAPQPGFWARVGAWWKRVRGK